MKTIKLSMLMCIGLMVPNIHANVVEEVASQGQTTEYVTNLVTHIINKGYEVLQPMYQKNPLLVGLGALTVISLGIKDSINKAHTTVKYAKSFLQQSINNMYSTLFWTGSGMVVMYYLMQERCVTNLKK